MTAVRRLKSCGLDSTGGLAFSPSLLGFSTKFAHLISSWGCSTRSPQQCSQTSAMVAEGLNKHKSRSSWDYLRLVPWNSRVSFFWVLLIKLSPRSSPIPGEVWIPGIMFLLEYNTTIPRESSVESMTMKGRDLKWEWTGKCKSWEDLRKSFWGNRRANPWTQSGKTACIRTRKKMSMSKMEGIRGEW